MMDIIINLDKSTWQIIYEILEVARKAGKEWPVAKHLVGAKFELRFNKP